MDATQRASATWRIFEAVTAYPRSVLLVALAICLLGGASALNLTRDTRPDAFMRDDHVDLLYWEDVKRSFGNGWTIQVAVFDEVPGGVFDPETLSLVHWLTEAVGRLPGVIPGRVTSITNARRLDRSPGGDRLVPVLEELPRTRAEAESFRDTIRAWRPHAANLLDANGQATLITADLRGEQWVRPVYEEIHRLSKVAPTRGETIHIGGAAAVDAWLGNYIDSDFRRLAKVSLLAIVTILVLCYRTLRGFLIPLAVVIGTVVVSFGSMAAAGVPFFVLTTALVVLLIGIGVADALHILGQYYREQASHPQASGRELAIRAMLPMWRPILFTSLTSGAGFLCLGLTSYLPPMGALGIFSTVGVGIAFLLSVFAMPAYLALLPPRPSPAFRPGGDGVPHPDAFGRMVASLGERALSRPKVTLAAGIAVFFVGVLGASKMTVNGIFIEVFQPHEPIRAADRLINERLSGTTTIDVIFEADDSGGILEPEKLRRIDAFQRYVAGLEHVRATASVVDYVAQAYAGLRGSDAGTAFPDERGAARGYLDAYRDNGGARELGGWITPDRRKANLRVSIDSGLYSIERAVVVPIERYSAENFSGSDLRATVSGRGKLHYVWIRELAKGHFTGVALALFAVWLMASLSFRSAAAGLFAMTPVCISVLFVYGVMGFKDIWLNAPSSMTAAIGFGTGVDFSIHFLNRLVTLVRDQRCDLHEAISRVLPDTGRALFFSVATVALGFGVLWLSQIPTMSNFGLLIFVAASTSFVFTITILPVMVVRLRPRFLGLAREGTAPRPAEFPIYGISKSTKIGEDHARSSVGARQSSNGSVR